MGKIIAKRPDIDCPKCGNWDRGLGSYGHRSVWNGPTYKIKYVTEPTLEHMYDDYLAWECSTCGYTVSTECMDHEEKNTR